MNYCTSFFLIIILLRCLIDVLFCFVTAFVICTQLFSTVDMLRVLAADCTLLLPGCFTNSTTQLKNYPNPLSHAKIALHFLIWLMDFYQLFVLLHCPPMLWLLICTGSMTSFYKLAHFKRVTYWSNVPFCMHLTWGHYLFQLLAYENCRKQKILHYLHATVFKTFYWLKILLTILCLVSLISIFF